MSGIDEYKKEKAQWSLHWDYECENLNLELVRLESKIENLFDCRRVMIGEALYVGLIDFVVDCFVSFKRVPEYKTLTMFIVLGSRLWHFINRLSEYEYHEHNIVCFSEDGGEQVREFEVVGANLSFFCKSLDKKLSSKLMEVYERNWKDDKDLNKNYQKLSSVLEDRGILNEIRMDYHRRANDMGWLMRLLNDEYRWYRDTIWKTKMQDLMKLLPKEHTEYYIRYEIDRLRHRLERSVFYRLHKRYSDVYLKHCDYKSLCMTILSVYCIPYYDFDLSEEEDGWKMNDLFDYFDIVLTWEFLENKLAGREVESHDLFEVDDEEVKERVEGQMRGHEEEYELLVSIMERMEPLLMEGYGKEDLRGLLEEVLMGGGKDSNRCWEFLMHNARIKLSTMSVGNIWMMIGYLVKCGVIKSVDQKGYMECVEGTEFGEKMKVSSVKSNLSNGKNLDKSGDECAEVFAKCMDGWVKKHKKGKGK